MHYTQQAVWRQSGCLFRDTLVVIWKLTARRTLSEPPPERQAAGRCVQAGCYNTDGKRLKANKSGSSDTERTQIAVPKPFAKKPKVCNQLEIFFNLLKKKQNIKNNVYLCKKIKNNIN